MKIFCSRFQENPRYKESVPLLVFNLTYSEGVLVFFRVFHIFQRGSRSTDVDGFGLHFPLRCSFLSYCATSFTLRGAPIHLYFPSLPIDLRIMVLEPGVAKDHALLPKVRDGKEHPFRVGFIMEDYIHHFGDLSCFVRGAVHVEHRYGTRDAPGTDTFHTDKILVYEVAGGSGVQKHFDRMYLAGIGGTDLYRQDDRRSAGVEGISRKSSGEFFFPFGPPRQGCPDQSGGRERGCIYRFTNFYIDFYV